METIKLDLIPRGKMPSLHASQYDEGRSYHIDLTENRVPYVLDGTETISLTVRKCDNTLVTMDIANTFANQSYIEFVTTQQMNACAGFNVGEIVLEENGDRIGSLNFYLLVEQAPDEGGITSQSEINNLNRQIDDYLDETLPNQIEEIAEPIIERLVPEEVNELVPSAVETVATPIVQQIAPQIVAEQVPIVIGDNYYTKTQVDNIAEPLADTLDYTTYIDSELTQNKYADYVNKVIGTLNGINVMTFNVENVSKILYKYTIGSPDLRGLYFTDVNNAGIAGYQALSTEREITVPTGAVTCYASVISADDILCYDIYGSLANFRTTLNSFAVRVKNVEDALEGEQPVEILKAQSSYTDKTSGGVTYTWNADNSKVTISGKRTSTSFNKMCGATNSLPTGFVAGKTYTIDFDPTDANIVLAFLIYENGVNTISKYFNGREDYALPNTVTGLEIRLQVINPNSVVGETVDCPEIFTIPEGKGLVERVGDLEDAVFGNDENPLASITKNAGLMSLFHTVGCIGDSLSSGECAYKSGGTTHYVDLYDFSWGQCLARLTGNTYYNFSQGGLTTKTWLSSQHATDCFDGNHNCDAYFIGLGQNDKNVSMTVGTTADIDLNDYNNNADTYCGNYGKIIQKIKELQPKAPIFCFVDPYPPSDDQNYNNAVKAVVALFQNVWLIDLDAYAKTMYRDSNEIIGSQLRAGHYSALGYQQMAYVIATYVDWLVRHNLSAFSQVEFIGTNYSW